MKSKSGFSLVEALVVIVILGISASAFMSLISYMTNAQKTLAQKQEMLDLKQLLLSNFADPATCTCMLNSTNNTFNGFPLNFDSTGPNATIELSTLYAGCNALNQPVTPIASEGALLLKSQNNVVVGRIFFDNINLTGGGNPNQYLGRFEIQFNANSLYCAPANYCCTTLRSHGPSLACSALFASMIAYPLARVHQDGSDPTIAHPSGTSMPPQLTIDQHRG